MSHGIRKPSLENQFPGNNNPLTLGLNKGVSGSEVPGGLGARAGLEPFGALPPLLGLGTSWRSQSPCFQRGAWEGLPCSWSRDCIGKISQAERRKTTKKKEKCAVIFKKPVSYCRFVSVLERPLFPQGSHTHGGVPGRRLCKKGGLGRPSVLHSFSRWSRYTCLTCARHGAGLGGVVWKPVLAPTELTQQCGTWEVNQAGPGDNRRV